MKRKFTFLMPAFMLLAFLAVPLGMRGQVTSGTTYSTPSINGLPTGWSGEDGGGTSYIKLIASGHYIQTSTFEQNGFTSIKLKARKFGGPSDDQALITVSWYYNNTETVLGTISPTSTTLTDYTISSPNNPVGNTTGYIKIQCKGAGSSKGSGVSEVTINYTAGTSGNLEDNDLALTSAPIALSFDLYNNSDEQVINYTTSSTGNVTVSSSVYINAVVDQVNKTITVTPTAVTPSTQTITVSQAADDTYDVGTATFTVDITDSTPGADVTFTAGTDLGSTGSNNSPDSMTKDGVTVSSTDAAFTTAQYRLYQNSETTISAPGYTITSIVFTGVDTGKPVSGLSVNGNNGTYSVNNNNNVGTWTGSASSVVFSASAQVRVGTIGIWMTANSTPTIAANPATLNTFSYLNTSQDPSAAQSVSISGTNLTNDITVSVGASSDFEISTTENGTYNNNDITIQATNGTVTATSIWVRMKSDLTGSHSGTLTLSSAPATSVTIPLNGEVIVPMTVAEAITAIDNSTATNHNVPDAYVTGIISNVGSFSSNSITYYISSDGTTTSTQLEVYKGKGLNGANFTGADDLGVGDQVVVHGTLTYYNNTTYEFSAGSEIVSLTPHQAQSYDLTVSALSNVEMYVYDVNDLSNELIEGGATAQTVQVSEGTSIQVLVSAAQGYALATFTVDGADHLADIDQYDSYTFTMPAHNVTISATAQQTYTISFYVNGTVDNTLEQSAIATLGTLPTPAAASVPTGFQFCGWMVKPANDYYNATTAPAMVNASTAVSADMNLAAVFAQADNSNLAIGELTADEIADEFAAGGHAYADDEVEYVDGDFTWAAKYSANNTRHWIQLKNDADVYLKIEAPSSIQSVEVVISNTSNSSGGIDDITMHGAYDATGYIYLNTTNGGTHVGTTSGSDVVNNHATIVPSGDNTTLYLQVDKGARIWGVTVTCGQSTYCDYTTLVVNHADGSYIAENISETLYGIHYINGGVGALYDLTNNGKLIINNGGVLDLSIVEFTNNTAANLIIKDGAQLKTQNAVEGTVEKNITGYSTSEGGYYLIAAPGEIDMTGSSYGFLPANHSEVDFYEFDQAYEGGEWRNQKYGSNQIAGPIGLSRGTGYLYANKNNTTLIFNTEKWTHPSMNNNYANSPFVPTDVNQTISVTYTNGVKFAGYNLIGNPYTCTAYLADGTQDFYRMNSTGDAIVLAASNERAIDVCEGIFVHCNATGTVTFTTTDPTVTSTGNNNGIVNISVAQVVNSRDAQPSADYARIRINNGNDMTKFVFNENTSRVYIPQGNKDYAVVRSEAQGEFPVNFKAAENGTYTIDVEAENLEVNYLHLIDNLTGMDVDLLATPTYTFESRKNDYASRFRLRFSANDNNNSVSDEFAFVSNGEIVIMNEGEATLQVIDMLGRTVSTQTVDGNARIDKMSANGVYVLRLIDGNEVKTQKIVIK